MDPAVGVVQPEYMMCLVSVHHREHTTDDPARSQGTAVRRFLGTYLALGLPVCQAGMLLVHVVPGDMHDGQSCRHTNFEAGEEAARRPFQYASRLGIPHVRRVGGMPGDGAGQPGWPVAGMAVERPVQTWGGMFVGHLPCAHLWFVYLGVNSVV